MGHFGVASSLCFKTGLINPLNPNIHIQILQTDLYTFPLRISWENLIKDHGSFSLEISLWILIILSLDTVWILLGENWFWSLLGLKGLRSYWCENDCFYSQANKVIFTGKVLYLASFWKWRFLEIRNGLLSRYKEWAIRVQVTWHPMSNPLFV